MTTDDTDTPGIGHNQPLRVGDELTAYLEETYAEDVARTEALMKRGEDFLVIATDEADAEATEFMVKVRARWKASEASRVAEKTPYDDNAGRVHAFFKAKVLDPLGLMPSDLGKRSFDPVKRTDIGLGPRINMAQTIFKVEKAEAERKRRAEEARIAALAEERRRQEAEAARHAAAEAERKAQEAAASAARKRNEETRQAAQAEAERLRLEAEAREREAANARQAENKAAEERAAAQASAGASMADMSRSRGERGGVASLKTHVDFRDIDRAELGRMPDPAARPPSILMLLPYLPDKALEQAVKGWIDANKASANTAIKTGVQPINGVVIFESHRSSGRA